MPTAAQSSSTATPSCRTTFNWVVTGQVEDGVSRFMQHLTGQYAQYLHGRLTIEDSV